MGYADVDRKAGDYEPPKFLKKLAERNGADISKAKSESEVRQIIEAAKKKSNGAAVAGKGAEPAKEGEVLPPLRYEHPFIMPQISLNLPALNAHVEANVGPQWWDCAANVKDALLFMALGSFITVLVMKGFGF